MVNKVKDHVWQMNDIADDDVHDNVDDMDFGLVE